MAKRRHSGQQEDLFFAAMGKVKCVTPSVTLAHPDVSFRRELYLLTPTIEEKEEEE